MLELEPSGKCGKAESDAPPFDGQQSFIEVVNSIEYRVVFTNQRFVFHDSEAPICPAQPVHGGWKLIAICNGMRQSRQCGASPTDVTLDRRLAITPTLRKLRTPPTPCPSQCGAHSACSRPDNLPHSSGEFPRKHPPPSHSTPHSQRTGSQRSSVRPIVQQGGHRTI